MKYLTDILDRAFPWVAALGGLLFAVALGLIFFYAPVERRSMGIVQKIFYAHVPAAMAAYAGFAVTAVASLLYLLQPKERWDLAAVSGAQLGLLFCAFVLVSGPLWAKKAWGVAWTWDPQLTATLVLFLVYGAYVLVRLFAPDRESTRQIAAVLGILGFVDIPIIHWSVKMWGGQHPTVERVGGGGLAPAMETAFFVAMAAFLILFAVLAWLSVRVRRLERRAEALGLDLADARRLGRTEEES